MTASYDLDHWLAHAGYVNHCFISYAHTTDRSVTECARRMCQAMKEKLGDDFYTPKVFLDENSLNPGDPWPEVIKRELCQSVTMIAVWSNMYFDQRHVWCGLEWATMQELSRIRLGGDGAIIPVKVREPRSGIPPAAARIQAVDFTLAASDLNYFDSNDFNREAERIAGQVYRIAKELYEANAPAGCDGFVYPTASAFPARPPAAPSLFGRL